MEQLIERVMRRVGLDRAQAEAAVAAVLEHLTATLPSPLVGRLHESLRGEAAARGVENRRADDSAANR